MLNIVREPAVLNQPVVDPAAWTAEDLDADQSWIHPLTDSEIADLDAAVARVEERGLDILDVTRDDFVLSTLGDRLDEIADDVVNGRGIGLIRGVPVERYSRMQAAIAFLGYRPLPRLSRVPELQGAPAGPRGRSRRHPQEPEAPRLPDPRQAAVPLRRLRRGGADVPAPGQVRRQQPVHQHPERVQRGAETPPRAGGGAGRPHLPRPARRGSRGQGPVVAAPDLQLLRGLPDGERGRHLRTLRPAVRAVAAPHRRNSRRRWISLPS